MKYFQAPWSLGLKCISFLSSALLVGLTLHWLRLTASDPHNGYHYLVLLVSPALLLGSALYTVRGYTITPDSILVHRLLWDTPLPRFGLQSASIDPDAMRWSLRTFGNGGLFSYTGHFRSRRLGPYRAFVTDPRRSVVLRYPVTTMVISPDSPEEFVHELELEEQSA